MKEVITRAQNTMNYIDHQKKKKQQKTTFQFNMEMNTGTLTAPNDYEDENQNTMRLLMT